jgi:phosphatidylserine/phosphatidylglycerophosphate/cardiolipin synthase-like enzyme
VARASSSIARGKRLPVVQHPPERNGVADFALAPRPVELALLGGRAHYEVVIARLRSANHSVWIATANLKELLIEGPRRSARSRDRFASVLELFDELAARGVELRLLHAGMPSRAFRAKFDTLPRLVQGGLELRQCPRVHFKTVVIDGQFCYLGSANWTGAGLGAKGEGRRNFELGFVSEDEGVIDRVQELFASVWAGGECAACKLRDEGCEAPLDL